MTETFCVCPENADSVQCDILIDALHMLLKPLLMHDDFRQLNIGRV